MRSAEAALTLAREGDELAFDELTAPYERELHLHCYRMLGSFHDAEDALQETLVAAWRGLDGYDGRASLRTWLHRIATNRCLNALRRESRRPRRDLAPPPFDPPEPTLRDEHSWLEPYPDTLLEGLPDVGPGPESRYEMKEAVELAFIAALHALPPRQRAVLILRDVLGYSTDEVSAMLATTSASVKGALQRARQTLQKRLPASETDRTQTPSLEHERSLAREFATAFERDDIEAVLRLLTDDAWLAMPPYPHVYQGRAGVGAFLRASAAWRAGRHYRLVPILANTQPAFGCYLPRIGGGMAEPAGLIVLTLAGERLAAITRFMDPAVFVPFGLPEALNQAG